MKTLREDAESVHCYIVSEMRINAMLVSLFEIGEGVVSAR